MHGSGTHLVNADDGVQLEIERDLFGTDDINCQVFEVSDSQLGIEERQLDSVQY